MTSVHGGCDLVIEVNISINMQRTVLLGRKEHVLGFTCSQSGESGTNGWITRETVCM